LCATFKDFWQGILKIIDFAFFEKSSIEIFKNTAQVCYFATFFYNNHFYIIKNRAKPYKVII
jgi:hypothetical protein